MKCPKCRAEIPDDSRLCGKCGSSIPSQREHGDADAGLGFGDEPPGTVLAGKFRILETVGRGGMGIVCKAEDMKLHRVVALKFLPPELVSKPDSRERFVVEARAAAALSHPNICTIHEIYDEGAKPFIEMEYVEGRNLRERIKARPLDAGEAVDIAIQVASALEAAHQKGVIHRDIKSANIMVTDNGQAKVMDFGLAKIRGETLYTREGTTLGTVGYMSPEQARGEEVDHRTDVWSLGVVLYEMLSGQLPFTGDRDAAILYSVLNKEPKPLKEARPGIPPELQRIVSQALKKELKARYASAAEMASDLKRYRDGLKAQELSVLTPRVVLRAIQKPKIAIPAAVCLIVLCAAGAWFLQRQSKLRWEREWAVPEIERLLSAMEPGFANYSKAYKLVGEAEKYVPGEPALSRLLEKCSTNIAIKTEPPGAAVYMKEFSAGDQQWRYLGVTPIGRVRVPFGYFWWKLEKQGYETVLAVSPTFQRDLRLRDSLRPYDILRVMDPKGKIPAGMVRVAGADTPIGRLGDFFIDKYEVTNKQYKEFVDHGGYRDRQYWKQKFIKGGRTLSWEEAVAEFLDQTGRPGPSTWQAGDYPKGQADYPVSGVSWYEAAAYAEYAGRSLPTQRHWAMAMGQFTPLWGTTGNGFLGQVSNFNREGPAAVGTYRSMTAYGAYDMGGNVREWCWNESQNGRIVRGGAWDDAAYMRTNVSQAPPFDRSSKNGFRCALYPDPGRIPGQAFEPFEVATTDFTRQKPVPDSVFQVYKEQFSYDKKELNARVELHESSADWVQEKVTIDAAYGNERLPIYLFLPKKSSPPYQTVIYVPGSGSVQQASSKELDSYREFQDRLKVLVKTGRAVVYPVYKGTFERGDDAIGAIHRGAPTRQFTEYLIQVVKDFRTCIDYLETRSDIDSKKIAYVGYSWGSQLSSFILSAEDRIRVSVLVVGGMHGLGRPEALETNYATRVTTPTLMLNGKYDLTFPFETNVKPMFDLLGTPAEHKRLMAFDTDHFVPYNEYVKETLAWLDRYLGPVK